MAAPSKPTAKYALALAALGVVFGDIGTSPLYAFRQCFINGLNVPPTHENVLGLLSLVLWSLIVIVFAWYIGVVMRLSHDGEGGIFALLALILPPVKRGIPPKATWLTLLILVGAGMLFGDGVITPAVSVLSSVEGLSEATSAAQPFIVPITAGILLALFLVQSRGTQRIGSMFGPAMLVWFLTIAGLGVYGIVKAPRVLFAINPIHAVAFLIHHGLPSIVIFGATVLCVSGVEALYADMSHFGRGPIAMAWTMVAFPALALNYLGQGALVLSDPHALSDPFYGLVPKALLYPVVGIATAATIIASQALISGVFTLTKQAIQLGFIPRVRVIYTSEEHRGQVFVPTVNVLVAVICIALVLGFRSSERLANAYGLAVATTMLVTTVAYYTVVRQQFKWSRFKAAAVTIPIFAIEMLFVVGSLPKIREGGWIPLLISAIVFVVASTWRTGRRRIATSYADQSIPVSGFLDDVTGKTAGGFTGTAVFLTGDSEGVPFVMRHHWARSHSFDERIVLLTIFPSNDPYLSDDKRVSIEHLSETLVRITACFGFMEKLDIAPIVRSCATEGLKLDDPNTTYYVADPVIVPAKKGAWRKWRRNLFGFLLRNARPVTQTLGIKADQLAKLGLEVPM